MNEMNILAIVILGFVLNLITTIAAIVRISISVEHRLTKLEAVLERINKNFELKYKE